MTWKPCRVDEERWLRLANESNHLKHWSRFFYDEARERGYEYAARPHGNFGGDKYVASDNPGAYLSLAWCRDLDIFGGSVLYSLAPDPYTKDGERLIMAHYADGTKGVAGYFMKLIP